MSQHATTTANAANARAVPGPPHTSVAKDIATSGTITATAIQGLLANA